LTLVSRRFYRLSQDTYVRAHYFLNHYGPVEAMFYALGRGKILNECVLDVRTVMSRIIENSHRPQSLDSVVKRGTTVSLSYPDCHASLLPHSLAFHQDSMGSQHSSPRFHIPVEGR